ncbi:MAG: response regulator [Vicinamibacterales bacterium]
MTRVLVADDVPIVREGLSSLIRGEADLTVCAEASSVGEVLARVRDTRSDLVLLGLMATGRGGLDALSELRRVHPRTPVLVFNMLPDDSLAVRVIRSGAAGYLSRGSAAREVMAAIRAVAAGRRYTSPAAGTHLASVLVGETARALHEELSDREFQVLRQLASGYTLTEIAETLSLSVKTISTYRTRVLAKLGVGSTAGLVRYAIEHRLV